MAESTLNLPKASFEDAIGVFFGFGPGPSTNWNTNQYSLIKQMRDEGHRIFYWPEPEQPGGPTYDWSFLHPTQTLIFPLGQNTLTLPDDFGGMEGSLTLLGSQVIATKLQFMPEPLIRQKFQELPQATGQPQFFSVAPIKGSTQVSSQRQSLLVWPTTDTEYTVQFQYYLLPDALSDNWPWSYGGVQHASTIREACLMAAEIFWDDVPRGEGNHGRQFMTRLAASMGADRKLKPRSGGKNEDRSDNVYGTWDRRWLYEQETVTFDGQSY